MDRRRFLLATLAAGAGSLAWRDALAQADEYAAQYRLAAQRMPWLRAYSGVDGDLATPSLRLEGRWPARLRGTLYRNGPALFERAGIRYHHLFDGDGMVQAFRFSDEGVSHTGRFVRTRKFVEESTQGRFVYPGFGTALGGVAFASGGGPDAFNVANTNVVMHAKRLMALWEGGSAHELDPVTLQTRGPVTWRPDLKGVPFSAHPKIEPDGTMWNTGAVPNTLVVYRIAPDGSLAHVQVLPVPGLVMNHDFAVSERHLVFLIPATRLDGEKLRGGAAFIDALSYPSDAPMRLLVLDKADLSRQRQFDLPPGFVFHFGNAWNEGDSTLHFDYVHHADARVLTDGLMGLMRGEAGKPRERSAVSTHVTVDLERGRIATEQMRDVVEFPRFDARRVGLRNRQLWHSAALDTDNGTLKLNAVVRYDLGSGARDAYRYEPECLVEEHVFVPDPASAREGAGWLVGCAWDVRKGRTCVNVLDATRLSAGPVARAWLPYGLPPGFHGHFEAA